MQKLTIKYRSRQAILSASLYKLKEPNYFHDGFAPALVGVSTPILSKEGRMRPPVKAPSNEERLGFLGDFVVGALWGAAVLPESRCVGDNCGIKLERRRAR